MKRITQLVLMFALAATASSFAQAQDAVAKSERTTSTPRGGPHVTATTEEILRLDRAYDQAFVRPTAEDMERLHTDDFMMTSRGRVTTKAELLARINDPNHPRQVIESLTSDQVKVRIYSDTAVTTGRWRRVSKSAEGKDTSFAGFFTRVWVKRDKTWQVAVAHYSPLASEVKPS